MRRSYGLAPFAVAYLLASCGDDGVPATTPPLRVQQAHPDVAKLVPPGAKGVLYLRDPAAAMGRARNMVHSFQPTFAGMVDLEGLLAMAGIRVRASELDTSRPLAVTSAANGAPIVVLPAKDPADVAENTFESTAISGSFVALGLDGAQAKVHEASAVVDGLPDADFALRFDLRSMRAEVESAEQQMHAMLRSDPQAEMVRAAYAPIWRALKRDGYVDVALDVGSRAMHLCAEVDGGEPARNPEPGVLALLQKLETSRDSIVVTGNADLLRLYEVFDPSWMIPDVPEAAAMRELAVLQKELYAAIAGPIVASFRLEDTGLGGVTVLAPDDVERAMAGIAAYGAKMPGAFGMTEVQSDTFEVDGATFRAFSFAFDATKLVGATTPGAVDSAASQAFLDALYGERTRFAIGRVGDEIWAILGGGRAEIERALAAAKSGAKPHAATVAAFERIGTEPWMFLHLDCAHLMRRLAVLGKSVPGFAKIPEVPSGIAAPVWIATSARGTRRSLDVGVDVAGLAALFKQR